MDLEVTSPVLYSRHLSRCLLFTLLSLALSSAAFNQSSIPAVRVSVPDIEPNPRRAVISEELLEWHDWLMDGGFEQGLTEVEVSNHPAGNLDLGQAERSMEAARTGDFGYAVTTGAGEGLVVEIQSYVDKGEDVRFSFWARSLNGEVELLPQVVWVERNEEQGPHESFAPENPFTIGNEWKQVQFQTENTKILRHALLAIQVDPNTTLHIDDVQMEQPVFKMASLPLGGRILGGIPVPGQPPAPTHISFTIHIEDPPRYSLTRVIFVLIRQYLPGWRNYCTGTADS